MVQTVLLLFLTFADEKPKEASKLTLEAKLAIALADANLARNEVLRAKLQAALDAAIAEAKKQCGGEIEAVAGPNGVPVDIRCVTPKDAPKP